MMLSFKLFRPAAKLPALLLLTAVLMVLSPVTEARAKATEGAPLPHFTGTDLDGNAIDTSKLGGEVLVIEFWSIYCSSCIQEMPHIVDLYNTYKDQGLTVLSINLDVLQAKRVPKFMKKNLEFTVTYPTIIDDKRRTIARTLNVGILPTTILVDPAGIVQMFHVGYKPGFEKELEEKIKKYLPAP